MDEQTRLGIEIEAVRDQLVAVIQHHESRAHAGEMCADERLNAIAYLAYALGLRPDKEAFRQIKQRLATYHSNDS